MHWWPDTPIFGLVVSTYLCTRPELFSPISEKSLKLLAPAVRFES